MNFYEHINYTQRENLRERRYFLVLMELAGNLVVFPNIPCIILLNHDFVFFSILTPVLVDCQVFFCMKNTGITRDPYWRDGGGINTRQGLK